MAKPEAPVERLRTTWKSLSAKPGGKWLFSKLFSRFIPYSGTVNPEILELSPGRAVIAIEERRKVQNHLHCVHAIALANLGEMSTGLALGFGMPAGTRSILVRVSCEYLKKARGRLVATAEAPAVVSAETRDYEVTSLIRDGKGETVAKTVAVWKVGPER
jgi:acyl-coenzyme A thioesterase PaaI-like protein